MPKRVPRAMTVACPAQWISRHPMPRIFSDPEAIAERRKQKLEEMQAMAEGRTAKHKKEQAKGE